MSFAAGLVVGGFAGTLVGVFLMSACFLSRQADERAGYDEGMVSSYDSRGKIIRRAIKK